MSRLRHLGWEQCSHGLTSRPLESCHHFRPRALCGLFGYPKGAAAELWGGTFKAPLLHHTFFQAFSPMEHFLVLMVKVVLLLLLPPEEIVVIMLLFGSG